MPAPELQSDVIAITGLAANLDRAKAGLLERVRELQAEQEDRVGFHWATRASTRAAVLSLHHHFGGSLAPWPLGSQFSQVARVAGHSVAVCVRGLSSGAVLVGIALFSSLLQQQS